MARVPASRRFIAMLAVLSIGSAACGGSSSSASPAPPAAPTTTPTPTPTAPPSPASAVPAPTPSPTPAPTPSPTPTPVVVKVPGPNEVYRFGPDLSTEERGRIKEWTAYGVRLQELMLGRRFTRFTVLASRDARWLAQQDCRVRPAGMSNCVAQQTEIYREALMGGCYPAPTTVRCFVVASLDVRGLTDDPFRGYQFAHESHHVFQGQRNLDGWRATMVGPDRVWTTGPVWLLEGAAEWIGWQVVIKRGLVTYDARRAEWEEWSRRIGLPLEKLETLAASDRTVNAYSLYALALDELLGSAPSGAKALTTYYSEVARGTAWKTAFKRAFGISVAAFYKRFATLRAGLTPT